MKLRSEGIPQDTQNDTLKLSKSEIISIQIHTNTVRVGHEIGRYWKNEGDVINLLKMCNLSCQPLNAWLHGGGRIVERSTPCQGRSLSLWKTAQKIS